MGCWWEGCFSWSSLSLYYFSYCLISLFSFSLTITISRFLLVFLYFCHLFISSFSLCHFASRSSSSILRRESFTTYASTSRLQYNHLWSSTGHWNDLHAVLCCTRYCLHNVWYLLCPSGSFFFPSGWWKQRGITGRAEEQWVFDLFFFDPPICHTSLPCWIVKPKDTTSPHRKKMNRMCEDSCYSQIFFFILYSLCLPFFLFFSPGWQSWVVQHLASELVLLYCRPGQQACGVQSSPSWQQPPLHHNEFCSSYLFALSSALFYLRRVWLNVKEKTFFFCLQMTRCSGGSKWCMWSNQCLVFVCFVFLRRRRGYII